MFLFLVKANILSIAANIAARYTKWRHMRFLKRMLRIAKRRNEVLVGALKKSQRFAEIATEAIVEYKKILMEEK